LDICKFIFILYIHLLSFGTFAWFPFETSEELMVQSSLNLSAREYKFLDFLCSLAEFLNAPVSLVVKF
jgi:hypothetical protein